MAAQALVRTKTVQSHSNAPLDIHAEALDSIIHNKALRVYAQPIVALQDEGIVGYEALVRGPQGSLLESADALFDAAGAAGLSFELEYQALVSSLNALHTLPEGHYLTLNVGPKLFVSKLFLELVNLCSYAADQLVFELTEHAPFTDIKAISERIRRVQAMGYRVALNDTGCGFANFELASVLQPAIVKLCSTTVAHILENPDHQASFKILFGELRDAAMTLLAEGIECPEDADVLQGLGVTLGQGNALGKPVPV